MSDEDTTTAGEGDLDFHTPEASDDEGDGGTGSRRAPPVPLSVNELPAGASDAGAFVEIQLPDELDAALTPDAVRIAQSYSTCIVHNLMLRCSSSSVFRASCQRDTPIVAKSCSLYCI